MLTLMMQHNFHALVVYWLLCYATFMILKSCKYVHVICIPFHDQDYDNLVKHEIPYLWHYELWTIFLWSRSIMDCWCWSCIQECHALSVYFYRVLGVLVPKKYSCVPRAMSYFHNTLSQAMFHRIQLVMWLKKSQKSHELIT